MAFHVRESEIWVMNKFNELVRYSKARPYGGISLEIPALQLRDYINFLYHTELGSFLSETEIQEMAPVVDAAFNLSLLKPVTPKDMSRKEGNGDVGREYMIGSRLLEEGSMSEVTIHSRGRISEKRLMTPDEAYMFYGVMAGELRDFRTFPEPPELKGLLERRLQQYYRMVAGVPKEGIVSPADPA